MSEEKWDKQTVAKCVYYICVHSNSKEFMDEVYKYQEQDRLSEIPTQIMNLYKQLQTAKEENEKLKEQMDLDMQGIIKLQKTCLTLIQQNKQMREAIENTIDKMVNCQSEDNCVDKDISCEDCYVKLLQQTLKGVE